MPHFFTTFHSLQPFFPSFYCYQIRALLPLEIEFRLMFFLLQSFFFCVFLEEGNRDCHIFSYVSGKSEARLQQSKGHNVDLIL